MTTWEDIEILVMDFDGTVGRDFKVWSRDGSIAKPCSGRDGLGLWIITSLCNIKVYVVSSEDSSITNKWCASHNINYIVCDKPVTKDTVLRGIARRHGTTVDNICYVGDDLNDMCAITVAGIGCIPSDAHPMLMACTSNYLLKSPGGAGAIREVCDYIYASHHRGCPLAISDKHCTDPEVCKDCGMKDYGNKVYSIYRGDR